MDATTKLSLTRTQFALSKLVLKTLPLIAILSGALFGYLEGHDVGHDVLATIRGLEIQSFPNGLPWYVILENMAICTAMGLTGGIALSCFGLVLLDCSTVIVEPVNRLTRNAGTDSGISSKTTKIYYKQEDIEDHKKTVRKVGEKYANIRLQEGVEFQRILPTGTDGTRANKLGEELSTKVQKTKRAAG